MKNNYSYIVISAMLGGFSSYLYIRSQITQGPFEKTDKMNEYTYRWTLVSAHHTQYPQSVSYCTRTEAAALALYTRFIERQWDNKKHGQRIIAFIKDPWIGQCP